MSVTKSPLADTRPLGRRLSGPLVTGLLLALVLVLVLVLALGLALVAANDPAAAGTSNVVVLTTTTFADVNSQPTFVKFFAPWSVGCLSVLCPSVLFAYFAFFRHIFHQGAQPIRAPP